MSIVVEIQDAVRALPEAQLEIFSSWFDEYEEKLWDRQIEKDQKSGPLNDLMKRAGVEYVAVYGNASMSDSLIP